MSNNTDPRQGMQGVRNEDLYQQESPEIKALRESLKNYRNAALSQYINHRHYGGLGSQSFVQDSPDDNFISYSRNSALRSWGDSSYDHPTLIGGDSGFSLDDIRDEEQNFFYSAVAALAKFANKSLTTSATTTAALLAGIASAADHTIEAMFTDREFSWNDFLNSPVNNRMVRTIASIDKYVDEKLFPIYRKESEKAAGLFSMEGFFSEATMGTFGDLFGFSKGAAMATGNTMSELMKAGLSPGKAGLIGAMFGAIGEGTIEAMHAGQEFQDEKAREAEFKLNTKILEIRERAKNDPKYAVESAALELEQAKHDYSQTMSMVDRERKTVENLTGVMNMAILTASNFWAFAQPHINGNYRMAKREYDASLRKLDDDLAKGKITQKNYDIQRKHLVENKDSILDDIMANRRAGISVDTDIHSGITATNNMSNPNFFTSSLKRMVPEQLEEQTQMIASETAKAMGDDYIMHFAPYGDKYKQGEDTKSFFRALAETTGKLVQSEQFWYEGMLGALIGGIGTPGIIDGKFQMEGNAWSEYSSDKEKHAENERIVNEINTRFHNSEAFQRAFFNTQDNVEAEARKQKALENGDMATYEGIQLAQDIKNISFAARRGILSKLEDYYASFVEGLTEQDAVEIMARSTAQDENGKLSGPFVTATGERMDAQEALEVLIENAQNRLDRIKFYRQAAEQVAAYGNLISEEVAEELTYLNALGYEVDNELRNFLDIRNGTYSYTWEGFREKIMEENPNDSFFLKRLKNDYWRNLERYGDGTVRDLIIKSFFYPGMAKHIIDKFIKKGEYLNDRISRYSDAFSAFETGEATEEQVELVTEAKKIGVSNAHELLDIAYFMNDLLEYNEHLKETYGEEISLEDAVAHFVKEVEGENAEQGVLALIHKNDTNLNRKYSIEKRMKSIFQKAKEGINLVREESTASQHATQTTQQTVTENQKIHNAFDKYKKAYGYQDGGLVHINELIRLFQEEGVSEVKDAQSLAAKLKSAKDQSLENLSYSVEGTLQLLNPILEVLENHYEQTSTGSWQKALVEIYDKFPELGSIPLDTLNSTTILSAIRTILEASQDSSLLQTFDEFTNNDVQNVAHLFEIDEMLFHFIFKYDMSASYREMLKKIGDVSKLIALDKALEDFKRFHTPLEVGTHIIFKEANGEVYLVFNDLQLAKAFASKYSVKLNQGEEYTEKFNISKSTYDSTTGKFSIDPEISIQGQSQNPPTNTSSNSNSSSNTGSSTNTPTNSQASQGNQTNPTTPASTVMYMKGLNPQKPAVDKAFGGSQRMIRIDTATGEATLEEGLTSKQIAAIHKNLDALVKSGAVQVIGNTKGNFNILAVVPGKASIDASKNISFDKPITIIVAPHSWKGIKNKQNYDKEIHELLKNIYYNYPSYLYGDEGISKTDAGDILLEAIIRLDAEKSKLDQETKAKAANNQSSQTTNTQQPSPQQVPAAPAQSSNPTQQANQNTPVAQQPDPQANTLASTDPDSSVQGTQQPAANTVNNSTQGNQAQTPTQSNPDPAAQIQQGTPDASTNTATQSQDNSQIVPTVPSNSNKSKRKSSTQSNTYPNTDTALTELRFDGNSGTKRNIYLGESTLDYLDKVYTGPHKELLMIAYKDLIGGIPSYTTGMSAFEYVDGNNLVKGETKISFLYKKIPGLGQIVVYTYTEINGEKQLLNVVNPSLYEQGGILEEAVNIAANSSEVIGELRDSNGTIITTTVLDISESSVPKAVKEGAIEWNEATDKSMQRTKRSVEAGNTVFMFVKSDKDGNHTIMTSGSEVITKDHIENYDSTIAVGRPFVLIKMPSTGLYRAFPVHTLTVAEKRSILEERLAQAEREFAEKRFPDKQGKSLALLAEAIRSTNGETLVQELEILFRQVLRETVIFRGQDIELFIEPKAERDDKGNIKKVEGLAIYFRGNQLNHNSEYEDSSYHSIKTFSPKSSSTLLAGHITQIAADANLSYFFGEEQLDPANLDSTLDRLHTDLGGFFAVNTRFSFSIREMTNGKQDGTTYKSSARAGTVPSYTERTLQFNSGNTLKVSYPEGGSANTTASITIGGVTRTIYNPYYLQGLTNLVKVIFDNDTSVKYVTVEDDGKGTTTYTYSHNGFTIVLTKTISNDEDEYGKAVATPVFSMNIPNRTLVQNEAMVTIVREFSEFIPFDESQSQAIDKVLADEGTELVDEHDDTYTIKENGNTVSMARASYVSTRKEDKDGAIVGMFDTTEKNDQARRLRAGRGVDLFVKRYIEYKKNKDNTHKDWIEGRLSNDNAKRIANTIDRLIEQFPDYEINISGPLLKYKDRKTGTMVGGRPDIILVNRDKGDVIIIDIKTRGNNPGKRSNYEVGYHDTQLGIYKKAFSYMTGVSEDNIQVGTISFLTTANTSEDLDPNGAERSEEDDALAFETLISHRNEIKLLHPESNNGEYIYAYNGSMPNRWIDFAQTVTNSITEVESTTKPSSKKSNSKKKTSTKKKSIDNTQATPESNELQEQPELDESSQTARNKFLQHIEGTGIDLDEETPFRSSEGYVPKTPTLMDKQRELTWLSKALPQLSRNDRIKIVNGTFRISSNYRQRHAAWGMFTGSMMILSDTAYAGTIYHEAFHAVFRMFLSEEDRSLLINAAKKHNSNLSTDLMAEEWLADEFMKYMIITEDSSVYAELSEEIGYLHKLAESWGDMELTMTSLFKRISEGGFREGELQELPTSIRVERLEAFLNGESSEALVINGTTIEIVPPGRESMNVDVFKDNVALHTNQMRLSSSNDIYSLLSSDGIIRDGKIYMTNSGMDRIGTLEYYSVAHNDTSLYKHFKAKHRVLSSLDMLMVNREQLDNINKCY